MSSQPAAKLVGKTVCGTPPSAQRKRRLADECQALGLTEGFFRSQRNQTFGDDELADECVRPLLAFSALSRGDTHAADSLLTLDRPIRCLEEKRMWLAASLYRACWKTPPLFDEISGLTQSLGAVLGVEQVETPEWSNTSLACATIAFAEGLLRMSDVGAARNQLEEAHARTEWPPGLLFIADLFLSAIEVGVGRSDLAEAHLQKAIAESAHNGPENRFFRLLLAGLLLGDRREEGQTRLAELAHGDFGPIEPNVGTVGRLFRVLCLAAQDGGLSLSDTIELRKNVSWLTKRHASAAYSLLVVSVVAGALMSGVEVCEGYDLLVQSAAEFRCRQMDGAADLVDRQIATLRGRLGPDEFEPLIKEAQQRRQARSAHGVHLGLP